MHALTVVLAKGGGANVLTGTLFGTPVELLSPEQLRRYQSAPNGWSTCPLGYQVYAREIHDGTKIVVPGVIVPGATKPRKKFPGYMVRFDRSPIEKFASSIEDEFARIEEAAAADLQTLTHDMRALSAEIYNSAELVKNDIINRNFAPALFKIDTVIAAQQMLSIRLDIVDFSTGQFADQPPERIPIYKKVDKVVKCLRPKSLAGGIELILQGPSSGFTFGPTIFELVPFVVVQNAIKYAPRGSEVVVKVSDFDIFVDVHVQSIGPRIRPDEQSRIFDRGYRGVDAQHTGRTGSGLGLFAAKSLLASGFGGTIEVQQDHRVFVHGEGDLWRTTFTFRVPRAA